MFKKGTYLFIKLTYIFIDVFFMGLSIYLACLLRPQTIAFETDIHGIFLNPINPYRFIFLLWIFLVILLNRTNNLYETKREIFESTEIWNIVQSVVMSAIIIVLAIYMLRIEMFPRSIFILVPVFAIVFFSVWRILKRMFVQHLVSQGYNNFNALIIGAGKVGQALKKEIEMKPGLGIKVVGFLDDFKGSEKISDTEILGKLNDFVRVCRREFVNKVFITIHPDSDVFLRLLEQAKSLGIAIRVVPQGFNLMPSDFYKYNIGFIPILEYSDVSARRSQAGKATFDFIVSTFSLIILSPLFLVVAVLIKLDSPGPVFHYSRRYGCCGKIFHMYKFRSMVTNAEELYQDLRDKNEADGPIFKIKNDPRITRIGRFLRRYSMDELPQLLNVLRGEMSLVGPRPLPIDQIEKEDLRQLRRLEVKPGITGLWQIRGRSDISFDRLVKWDAWYISNWSFWLDMNILLQTIPVVLKGRGAY